MSCAPPKKVYRIGIDPSFYPLELGHKQGNVYAFTMELLRKVGLSENIAMESVAESWDNLLLGLNKGKYDAIISSMFETQENKEEFIFSTTLLHTGPVLVVRSDEKVGGISTLDDKFIAVKSVRQEVLVIDNNPSAIVSYYTSVPRVLQDLISNSIDAALIDRLFAATFIKNSFDNKLKIASAPLSSEGLRVVTKKEGVKNLVKTINQGIDRLYQSEEYENLLNKWDLN